MQYVLWPLFRLRTGCKRWTLPDKLSLKRMNPPIWNSAYMLWIVIVVPNTSMCSVVTWKLSPFRWLWISRMARFFCISSSSLLIFLFSASRASTILAWRTRCSSIACEWIMVMYTILKPPSQNIMPKAKLHHDSKHIPNGPSVKHLAKASQSHHQKT